MTIDNVVAAAVRLEHQWRFRDCLPGTGQDWASAEVDEHWWTTDVPVDVHTALLARGVIPDPYVGRNVEDCQWIEDREWWFRHDLPPWPAAGEADRDYLTFDGLDTCATVFLDGEALTSHANMHLPLELDVTGRLTGDGGHRLAVRFDPVRAAAAGKSIPGQWGNYFADERVAVRKAQAQYSWDHCPRLVNVGMWQPVWLRRFSAARMRPAHVRILRADARNAVVDVEVNIEQWAGQQAVVTTRLDGHGHTETVSAPIRDGSAVLTHVVPNPSLWWPAGHGGQPLYDLTISLSVDGVESDHSRTRVGLRTVRLDREPSPEEPGSERFTFVVNGTPVFAKGANWVPADILNTRTTSERYRRLLSLLVRANGNMVRVWGGGQYEPDSFYDICDELGLLVWQDFMLACGRYPDDDEDFVRNVEAEAAHQVTRLRSHPCLALWCGSNEIDILEDKARGLTPGAPYPGYHLVHDVIHAVVTDLDPDTAWWPSSPFGGDDHNSQEAGDRHNWITWHGAPARRKFGTPLARSADRRIGPLTPGDVSFHHLERDRCRFLSEFGVHAVPLASTMRRYLPDDELQFGSEMLRFRDRNGRVGRLDLLMQAHTGLPSTFTEYVTNSMWCQAEGLRRAIEVARARMWTCSGTLIWQWNDCWPGITWSVLDVLDRPKAGYYAVRRAFAPVLLAAVEDAGMVGLSLVNDTVDGVRDTVWWRLQRCTGEVISDGKADIEVAANSSGVVTTLPAPPDVLRSDAVLWFGTANRSTDDGRLLFAEIRDLRRPAATVTATWREQGSDLVGSFTTDAAAFFVHLEDPDGAAVFSDNWFDLPPGRSHTVVLPGCADSDPSQMTLEWL